MNGQSKFEYEKNYSRIDDIILKAKGDRDKEIKLATLQANKITDQYKAINRAKAAHDRGYEHLYEVFFRRAHKIGGVSTQDYREYVIQKLLEDDTDNGNQ